MKRVIATFFLLFAALIVFRGGSPGAVLATDDPFNVHDCGTLSAPGNYVLTDNLVHDGTPNSTCITIGADNITFSNPDGFTITGIGASNVSGIRIANKTGVVIEDQIVSNFRYGINIFGDVTGTIIRRNTTSGNERFGAGISAIAATNGEIINNSVNGNIGPGI